MKNDDGNILCTTTGEIFQPVRIYYNIKNKDVIKRLFKKLKCISYDREYDRYVWLYHKESKKIKFAKPSGIVNKLNTIVLGSFYNKNNNLMYLEVRSIERAIEGILFFDKYIKTYMASVGDISIVNRLFSYKEGELNFSYLFKNEVRINPEEKLNKIKNMMSQGESLENIFDMSGNDKLPAVERFPSHYHEDGILPIKLSFQGRQHVAKEHWLGNNDYSLSDFIRTT